MPTALSCLLSAQRWWSLSSHCASVHTHAKNRKRKKIFPNQAWQAPQQCGECLNTEVRGEKPILYVYGWGTKRSVRIAVLIITTWSDFLTTHWLLTAPTVSDSREWGYAECFGNPGVIFASRYSNWLRALEWFGPTAPSDCSSPRIYTVCLPGEFYFPICFQHLLNLSTSQPGWSGLSHTGALMIITIIVIGELCLPPRAAIGARAYVRI